MVSAYVESLKLRVGTFIGLAAVLGYLATLPPAPAAGGSALAPLVLLFAATVIAAGGAGALNHVLDRDLDARMPRTARRPLPSGRIRHVWHVVALGLGLVGDRREPRVLAAQPAGGAPRLPRRVHVRRRLHRLAQATVLAQRGDRRAGRLLRRPRRRLGRAGRALPAARPVRARALLLEPFPLLEPGHRLQAGLRGRAHPHAPGRQGRGRGRPGHSPEHGRASHREHPAVRAGDPGLGVPRARGRGGRRACS